ncbi:Pseudouridine synthase, catalytic domain,Pseudouridine synthase, RsuA/RluB/C/D/E/F [Cinara cedri]|uniref:Pseudouridine synthase, catalytic domain,Pseudouridine synthase, RsuA/RluB/C/D/E/F n=1 Tax=Cinara cedri TaxID=506608 RepID=A0A5E4M1C0_9HEMI|nr:Pseudouridine synthase, catalytic domain,Pseudouridine synthase, RsuA/RluB/C/D/E/F [Cinara cedri]
MIFEDLINFFKYVLDHILCSLKLCGDLNHIDVEILYLSKDYIIVNKPEDVFTNNHGKDRPSLDILLGKKYPHLVNSNLEYGFYFVHRLDYVTSGVLCIALNKQACAIASTAMQKRISRKYYIALLRGHVSADNMDLISPIGYCSRELNGNHIMCTADNGCCTSPRSAHTRLAVLERGVFMSYPATKVLMLLVTGRRHQIRVHCSAIGHTVIGDYTYSGRRDTTPSRTFLHSYRLELGFGDINLQTNDPFTKNKLNGLWTPVEFVNKLGENCLDLFNQPTICS